MSTTYYLVKAANGVTFEARTWGGPKDLLLVPQGNILPMSPKDLIVLHEKHANHSKPMLWNDSDATFTCQHCDESINMSDALFELILGIC